MNRIKELREKIGLSQEKLATNLAVNLRTLQRWENDETAIRKKNAEKIADYFGVSISVLLGFRDTSDSLGFKLWTLRNEKDIELKKAAQDLNLSEEELGRLERTDNLELGNVLAKDFADYYGVPVTHLLEQKTVGDALELATLVSTKQIELSDILDENMREAVSNYINLNKGIAHHKPMTVDYSMLNAIEKINDIKLVDEMMTDSMLANRVLDRLRSYMMESGIIKAGSYNWEIERVMSWLIDFNDELFKRKVSLSGGKISSSPSQNYPNDDLYKTDNDS